MHLEISEQEKQILINGLWDQRLETERYLNGMPTPDREPEPHDVCCAWHRLRYESRLETAKALIDKEDAIVALTARLEAL